MSFFNLSIFVVCLGLAGAFTAPRAVVKGIQSQLKMVGEDYPGTVGIGYFDPLNLAPKDENTFKRYRESELKHGRIAMIASVAIIISEKYHPFQDIDGPAIFQFQRIGEIIPNFWLVPLFLTGIFESYSITKGWADVSETSGTLAWLKPEYVPGDVDFDPLGFKPAGSDDFFDLSAEFKDIRAKELNNGRLAMVATAGLIAQELVDGRPILERLGEFGLSR